MIGTGWAGAIIAEEQLPKEPLATGSPLGHTLRRHDRTDPL